MTTTVAFNKSWNSPLTAWNTDTWNGGGAFPSATGSINSVSITISQQVTGVAATSAIGNTFETNVGLGATGSIGTVTLDGDARVTVTGLSGTTALGNVFETQNGLSATTALGNTFETNVGVSATGGVGSTTIVVNAAASVTGISGTTALGNTFETNVGVNATSGVGSSTVTGDANIEPSGFRAQSQLNGGGVTVGLGTRIEVTGLSATTSMGQVLVWGLVVVNQNPNFNTIGGPTAPPLQVPNFSTIGGATAPPLQVPTWIDKAA